MRHLRPKRNSIPLKSLAPGDDQSVKDPAASDWLKVALVQAINRDPARKCTSTFRSSPPLTELEALLPWNVKPLLKAAAGPAV
jgi:hypothetical protein